ncbi:MAG: aminotransferase class IV [Candidatus Omnitrophica bacterium]|nr:aminotransferase class IV [Candidatus Omnitrophota bacterium]
MKIFCNSKFVEKETIEEIFEPGFLFGWGVYEALRAYGGKVPFLAMHTDRLNKGLEILGIDKIDLDFPGAIKKLLSENKLEDAYIRITAYKKRNSTGVLIYADKFGYYQKDAYEKGFSAIISPYRRDTKSPFSQIKSLSYIENRMSWFKAQQANKDEALLVNQEDYLIGGSRSNLFLVTGREIVTPSVKSGAFMGITRNRLVNELMDLRIRIKEKELSLEDLYEADEAFLTSSLLEVMPLVECASKKIGDGLPGKMTKEILNQYRELCREA